MTGTVDYLGQRKHLCMFNLDTLDDLDILDMDDLDIWHD